MHIVLSSPLKIVTIAVIYQIIIKEYCVTTAVSYNI